MNNGARMQVFQFSRKHRVRIGYLVGGVVLILLYVWYTWSGESETTQQHAKQQDKQVMDDRPVPAKFPTNKYGTYDMMKHTGSLKFQDRHFLLNGQPLRILSGALHYFRVPHIYWRDRLLTMKACGLNTVETYVPWNLHEEIREEFNFEGNLDLRKFLLLAKEVGLYVIFRPGPYICSEWDLGGLPSWLLHDPEMKLRSNYEPYMDAVGEYFRVLIPKISDLQYAHGGPIIMVQVENEFGSYSGDVHHLEFIRDLLTKLGIRETLVISENGQGAGVAPLNQVLLTANFKKIERGRAMFDMIRSIGPDIPLMVMEFWTGWFDHWGEPHSTLSVKDFSETLEFILNEGGSVNLYMYHGGTNFGFMAGRNDGSLADVTSYDYDAPLSESGDTTPKYFAVRRILLENILKPQGLAMADLPEPPPNLPKASYGTVAITEYLPWKDCVLLSGKPIMSEKLVTMEMLDINNNGGQSFGFILYRQMLGEGGVLKMSADVRDRAQVILNSKELGVIQATDEGGRTFAIQGHLESTLDILVENQGRINYGRSMDTERKGLSGEVRFNRQPMKKWQIYPLEFKPPYIKKILSEKSAWEKRMDSYPVPALYHGILTVLGEPADTFLNMDGWKKGFVYINEYNLGRYWEIGPQGTLYVPGPYLKRGDNHIVIFEQHRAGSTVTFQDTPILDKTPSQP